LVLGIPSKEKLANLYGKTLYSPKNGVNSSNNINVVSYNKIPDFDKVKN
jgi:hypothetical protein